MIELITFTDVWSRLCGGSGAPGILGSFLRLPVPNSKCIGWTLELAGFDVSALSDTYAAHIHAENTEPSSPPPSAWPTGMYSWTGRVSSNVSVRLPEASLYYDVHPVLGRRRICTELEDTPGAPCPSDIRFSTTIWGRRCWHRYISAGQHDRGIRQACLETASVFCSVR